MHIWIPTCAICSKDLSGSLTEAFPRIGAVQPSNRAPIARAPRPAKAICTTDVRVGRGQPLPPPCKIALAIMRPRHAPYVIRSRGKRSLWGLRMTQKERPKRPAMGEQAHESHAKQTASRYPNSSIPKKSLPEGADSPRTCFAMREFPLGSAFLPDKG